MNHVIAISGPVGGGKTSLVKSLVARLPDAVAIHCDSYERASEASRDGVMQWMRDGADPNALLIPQLPEHLERLKRGETVLEPLHQSEVPARKFILLETNFGREHRASARYIDLLIWIDTPLDIALARKVGELTGHFLERYPAEQLASCLRWLQDWLENYLQFTRELLVIQKERIAPTADLVLDGRRPAAALVDDAARAIVNWLPPG